jgi:hypothetical protein
MTKVATLRESWVVDVKLSRYVWGLISFVDENPWYTQGGGQDR